MKRFVFYLVFISVICAVTAFSSEGRGRSSGTDGQGHSLISLWQEYGEAAEKDLPETMSQVLARIKSEALRLGLSWDYYDAGRKYVEAESSRNWKVRDTLMKRMDEDLSDYGAPLLVWLNDLETYSVTPDSLMNFVAARREILSGSHTRGISQGMNPFVGSHYLAPLQELMPELLKNDYQFALCTLMMNRHFGRSESGKMLFSYVEEAFGKAYPVSAFVRFHILMQTEEREGLRAALEGFMKEYKGKAVSLLAEQEILNLDFGHMEGKADSDDYKAFRTRLRDFEKRRKTFRGSEGTIAERCTRVEDILRIMEESVLEVSVKDSEAVFYLRNMERVRVEVMSGRKVVHDEWLYGKVDALYAYDTVRMKLPVMDDGDYVLKCSDGKGEVGRYEFGRYTLSSAVRCMSGSGNAGTAGFYVADYFTGEPLGEAVLSFFSNGRQIAGVDDFQMDGFTRLPSSIAEGLPESGCQMQASCVGDDGCIRKSPMLMFSSAGEVYNSKETLSAAIFNGQSAYRPGEIFRFKGVVYRNLSDGRMETVCEGTPVKAVLYDASASPVQEKLLFTNEFGSVSSDLLLSGMKRNGQFLLRLFCDDRMIGVSSFVVDEFVLPSYEIVFDASDRFYLPGDVVRVSGVLKSLSGRSLASASVEYVLRLNDVIKDKGNLNISPDGSFELDFIAEGEGGYVHAVLDVNVVDMTGQTQSFTHHVSVSSYLNVSARHLDPSKGSFQRSSYSADSWRRRTTLLSGDKARILCALSDGKSRGTERNSLKYELRKEGTSVQDGKVESGDTLDLDFNGMPSGIYEFVLSASQTDVYGKETRDTSFLEIVRLEEDMVSMPFEHVFRVIDDTRVACRIASGTGPLWVVAELYGDDGRLLEKKIVRVGGKSGSSVGNHLLYMPRKDNWTDGVTLKLFYFKNGKSFQWSHEFRALKDVAQMPLSFERFVNKTLPSSDCSISVRTLSGAEVLAAVFDKGSEQIRSNVWRPVTARKIKSVPVWISAGCGSCGDGGRWRVSADGTFFSSGFSGTRMQGGQMHVKNSYAGAFRVESESMDAATADFLSVEEEAATASAAVRSDFSTALAFEPFLRPDDDGMVSFAFRTSGKLSTFVVSLAAHDKHMNNSVLRKEMLVSLPVNVNVSEPDFLYEGDAWHMSASVSNDSSDDVKGVLRIEVFDGKDYMSSEPMLVSSYGIDLEAGSASRAYFTVDVPSVDTLGLKVTFRGGGFSDGMFVSVPVFSAEQELMEAHSAVLLPGMSRKDVLDSLEKEFVNVSAYGAEYKETVLADILRASLPLVRKADGKDVISRSEALYVNMLSYGLHDRLGDLSVPEMDDYVKVSLNMFAKIVAAANSDGGFGWFDGMPSSPVVTAVVLERFASLRDRGLLELLEKDSGEDDLDLFDEAVVGAVKYLDRSIVRNMERPSWTGTLSLWQYVNVRSMYAGVPFDVKTMQDEHGIKRIKEFEKIVSGLFSGTRTHADILTKVRMIHVLKSLGSSSQGTELAKAWGLKKDSFSRRSMGEEISSLMEYAQRHPSGGWYYPNAVQLWRGLLESEAYAHSRICDLFGELVSEEGPSVSSESISAEDKTRMKDIADGIRLWLILQKETQEWDSDPGYVEAMASVYDGSDAVMDTRVIVSTKRYLKPFDKIEQAGNGMKVGVKYFKLEAQVRADDGSSSGFRRTPLEDGDILNVGDKVVAVYTLWNAENRSFVCLNAPRAALFRPADQLSGWAGGWLRPLSYGEHRLSPYCYREVKHDRTLYWIDICPEEETVFEEELSVTQAGIFSMPVMEVESHYCPHYRANAEGGKIFISEKSE